MVKITLEDDEVGFREVEEKIRGFVDHVPESVSRAPERMLLVFPLALLLVLLKTKASADIHG